MKKILLSFFGIALFIVGYQYTRRQAAYVATQRAASKPTYATSTPEQTPQLRNTLAYRLIKPS